MDGLTRIWSRFHSGDPVLLAILGVIAVVALVRGWSLLLLAILVIALAQGLHYLLGHAALGPGFARGAVVGVYAFGGALFLFLAIAHYFTKR